MSETNGSAASFPAHADTPPKGLLRRLLRRLCFFAAACVGAAVLLELLVLLIFGEQHKTPRMVIGAPWGIRYNIPGAHYRHKSSQYSVWFDINRQGMRADVDYTYEKPRGRKRIVAIGDSFTMAYEVENDESFAMVLQRELRSRGYDVEVLNAGVSGFGTAEELVYLERELLRYDPDVVLVSFFTNDLIDNVRSNLFKLDDGRLVEASHDYVPMGSLANFLNSSWVFQKLSEYSNAFTLLKQQITMFLKKRMVETQVVSGDGTAAKSGQSDAFLYDLTAAIYERLYEVCRGRQIPLLIQSIPAREIDAGGKPGLVDLFDVQRFDVNRPGIYFLAATSFLQPYVGKKKLYYDHVIGFTHTHGHWTPFAQALSGTRLAEVIVQKGLLR